MDVFHVNEMFNSSTQKPSSSQQNISVPLYIKDHFSSESDIMDTGGGDGECIVISHVDQADEGTTCEKKYMEGNLMSGINTSDGEINPECNAWRFNDNITALNLSKGENSSADGNLVEQTQYASPSDENFQKQFLHFAEKKLSAVSETVKQSILSTEQKDTREIEFDYPTGELSEGCHQLLTEEQAIGVEESHKTSSLCTQNDIAQTEMAEKDISGVDSDCVLEKRKTLKQEPTECTKTVHIEDNAPDYVKISPIRKSSIKMTFKKRKFKMTEISPEDADNNTKDLNLQSGKIFYQNREEGKLASSDEDFLSCNSDENVPVDFSMHASLVRQNMSKTKQVIKTEAEIQHSGESEVSDQDKKSFCSSLKLKLVAEKQPAPEKLARRRRKRKAVNYDDSLTDDSNDCEKDNKSAEEKDLDKVDDLVLDRLLSNSNIKKNVKKKETATKQTSNDKVFTCDTCSKSFTRKSSWRHHVKIHIDDKFKECKVCGKKLKFSANMLSHLKTHTGDRPFKCDFCEKKFTRAASLYTHIRSHTGEKAFLCEICGKGFGDKSHYRRHIRIHSGIKPFKCDVCEMAFTQSWSLKSHMLSHLEEKPHICSLCGKGYTQRAYLESHIRSHTGERPFSCETCGKSFSDSSCMRRHAKSHLGERSFICELCGKAFGRSWNLTVHMRIHYDDKRYECFICGKAFVQKINLDKHILTHDNNR